MTPPPVATPRRAKRPADTPITAYTYYSTRNMPTPLLARLRVLALARRSTLEQTLVAALEIGAGYLEAKSLGGPP